MKKIISTLLLAVLFQACPAQAGLFDQGCCEPSCCDSCCDPCCCEGMGPITVDARFAALFRLDRRHGGHHGEFVRRHNNHNNVLPFFQVELATTWNCNWQPWVNVGYAWDNGRKNHDCFGKQRENIIPLAFGVNYLIPMCNCIDAYVGAGAVYTWFRRERHDHFHFDGFHDRHNKTKTGWGAVAKAGFYYNYSECVFFEGFVNYYWVNIERNKHHHRDEPIVFARRHRNNDKNLSALALGVGVGFKF